MLVVCNGAYKSGSSWLFHIVQELADFRFPQREYQNAEWRKVPSIAPDRLASFLEEGSFREHDFVAKQHFAEAEQRRLLSQTPGVFVLDIERDLRDVVVSAYYHHVRLGRFVGSFDNFYWIEGRLIADRVTRYHRVWQQESSQNVLCVSYEALHADFEREVLRIARFLGLEVSQDRFERVRERTSLEQLRQRYMEPADDSKPRFYRKGRTGDWQTHLTASMLDDLARVEAGGLAVWSRLGCVLQIKLHRAVRAWPKTRLRKIEPHPSR